jgi:hypothetical protein
VQYIGLFLGAFTDRLIILAIWLQEYKAWELFGFKKYQAWELFGFKNIKHGTLFKFLLLVVEV